MVLYKTLESMVETPTGCTESLPRAVKQFSKSFKFHEHGGKPDSDGVHDLQRREAVLHQPLFDKRFEITDAIHGSTKKNVNGNQMNKVSFQRG